MRPLRQPREKLVSPFKRERNRYRLPMEVLKYAHIYFAEQSHQVEVLVGELGAHVGREPLHQRSREVLESAVLQRTREASEDRGQDFFIQAEVLDPHRQSRLKRVSRPSIALFWSDLAHHGSRLPRKDAYVSRLHFG